MSIRSRLILWLIAVIDGSLYDSIPDCPKCNQIAMKCFCDHIDVIVVKGADTK